MFSYIQKKYKLTNYQTRQLKYWYVMNISEISKFLILLFIFKKDISLYLFSVFILICLRTSTGGIHCKTYFSCFMTTFFFLYMGIILLPSITLPLLHQCLFLLICGVMNYIIGPITACGHPQLMISAIKRARQKAFMFILLYAISLCIIPVNRLLQTGFWIIILHTLQLGIAKIRYRKEMFNNENQAV